MDERPVLLTGATGYIWQPPASRARGRRLHGAVSRASARASGGQPGHHRGSSIVDAPAADVFRWHEQPRALATLTPAALVRIEQQEGGIHDGGRVTVSIGLGRAGVRWSMRHHGYIDGRRFFDEQVAGPSAVWRHAHCSSRSGRRRRSTLIGSSLPFPVAAR